MLEDGKTEVYLLGYKKLVQNEGYRSSLLTHHNLKDTKLTIPEVSSVRRGQNI